MYKLGQIFTQTPETVKTTVMALVAAFLVIKHVDVSTESLATGGLAFERLLTLFYTGPIKAANESKAITAAATKAADKKELDLHQYLTALKSQTRAAQVRRAQGAAPRPKAR